MGNHVIVDLVNITVVIVLVNEIYNVDSSFLSFFILNIKLEVYKALKNVI
jgi:hypothetical protein